MPVIFGLPQVGFWQALGLTALSWILFGMRRMGGGRRGCVPDGDRNFAAEGFTPEQREHFPSKFERRCGAGAQSVTTEPA